MRLKAYLAYNRLKRSSCLNWWDSCWRAPMLSHLKLISQYTERILLVTNEWLLSHYPLHNNWKTAAKHFTVYGAYGGKPEKRGRGGWDRDRVTDRNFTTMKTIIFSDKCENSILVTPNNDRTQIHVHWKTTLSNNNYDCVYQVNTTNHTTNVKPTIH